MRFGFNWATAATEAELEELLPVIDDLGLGTIVPPPDFESWTVAECEEYGEMVRAHGLTIGEAGHFGTNLLADDDTRSEHVQSLRDCLVRADAMGVDCVASIVGTRADERIDYPHPENYGEEAKARAEETIHRTLDGLDLEGTVYTLEPYCNTFFHQPSEIRAFLDRVDDPRLGVHLDIANMHSIDTYFQSERLIEDAVDLLGGEIASVHAKDLHWEPGHLFVRIDEVPPEQGVIDYDTYLSELDGLDPDLPVYTEHWDTEETYVSTMETLHDVADRNGIQVRGRDGHDQ